jgi:hypothetical protein
MVDEAKLNEFVGRIVGDMGGAMGALLAFVGDRLGLYRAMAGAGPMTAEVLAKKTGTNPRMIKEWLANQAAGGYVEYDAKAGTYALSEEQAIALAQEGSPAFMQGGFQVIVSLFKDEQKIAEAMRTGRGRPRQVPVRGHRAVLPARLQRKPDFQLDTGARRGQVQAGKGRQGGRRGLRPRGVDDTDGQDVPQFQVLWL